MSEELQDLRAKITIEAKLALDAASEITGMEVSELVRNILHRWAIQQRLIGKLLDKKWKAQGLTGSYAGMTGKDLGHDALEVTGVHRTLRGRNDESHD